VTFTNYTVFWLGYSRKNCSAHLTSTFLVAPYKVNCFICSISCDLYKLYSILTLVWSYKLLQPKGLDDRAITKFHSNQFPDENNKFPTGSQLTSERNKKYLAFKQVQANLMGYIIDNIDSPRLQIKESIFKILTFLISQPNSTMWPFVRIVSKRRF